MARWLGGFRSAKAALIVPNPPSLLDRPPAPARTRAPLPPIDWRVAGGMAAFGAMVGAGSFASRLPAAGIGALALLALYLAMHRLVNQPQAVPARQRRNRRTRQHHFAVRADLHGFRFRGHGQRRRVRWQDVVDVLRWPREVVIRLASGDELRVPVLWEFEPFFAVLQLIAAERRRHEEELLARMERGLSAPAFDDEAHRGLSVAEE